MTQTAEVFERTVETLKAVIEATCPVCGGGWFSTREGERQGAIHHVRCPNSGAEPNTESRPKGGG